MVSASNLMLGPHHGCSLKAHYLHNPLIFIVFTSQTFRPCVDVPQAHGSVHCIVHVLIYCIVTRVLFARASTHILSVRNSNVHTRLLLFTQTKHFTLWTTCWLLCRWSSWHHVHRLKLLSAQDHMITTSRTYANTCGLSYCIKNFSIHTAHHGSHLMHDFICAWHTAGLSIRMQAWIHTQHSHCNALYKHTHEALTAARGNHLIHGLGETYGLHCQKHTDAISFHTR